MGTWKALGKTNTNLEHFTTFIYHILTNSTEKATQAGIIEMGLSDHELIYCLRKTSLLKLHEHKEILLRSMKNYAR